MLWGKIFERNKEIRMGGQIFQAEKHSDFAENRKNAYNTGVNLTLTSALVPWGGGSEEDALLNLKPSQKIMSLKFCKLSFRRKETCYSKRKPP